MVNSQREKWIIDPVHSEIDFKIRHLMITNVKGNFKEFDASIYTTGNDFLTAEVDCWINAASVDTGNEDRDTQVKSADFFDVEKDVYPIGRLDYDSEGLLILTNDKQLNHRLLNPSFAHMREYWVQVDGAINDNAINILQQGVSINIDGKLYNTKPAIAMLLSDPIVCERDPPIRFRKDIPTSWISLILTEGKNRQVRKMTAAVGFPTLR